MSQPNLFHFHCNKKSKMMIKSVTYYYVSKGLAGNNFEINTTSGIFSSAYLTTSITSASPLRALPALLLSTWKCLWYRRRHLCHFKLLTQHRTARGTMYKWSSYYQLHVFSSKMDGTLHEREESERKWWWCFGFHWLVFFVFILCSHVLSTTAICCVLHKMLTSLCSYNV